MRKEQGRIARLEENIARPFADYIFRNKAQPSPSAIRESCVCYLYGIDTHYALKIDRIVCRHGWRKRAISPAGWTIIKPAFPQKGLSWPPIFLRRYTRAYAQYQSDYFFTHTAPPAQGLNT
jgi:hypothetical protein